MTRPTWGDTIRIKGIAPADLRPGQIAAVCGMRAVENSDQAKQLGCEIGTTLYLVELGDGHSAEIPEHFVEIVDD
jgi:hypothetical protein